MEYNRIDYSIWTRKTSLSVNDAITIITNYQYKCILDKNGTSDSNYEDMYNNVKDLVAIGLDDFTDDVIYLLPVESIKSGVENLPEEMPYIEKVRLIFTFVDSTKTKVNIYDFVKWCHISNIALPIEIINIATSANALTDSLVVMKETLKQMSLNSSEKIEVPDSKTVDSYKFIHTPNGWYLQFEDVVLKDVKKWVGMEYIKLLLQHAGQPLFVLNMQQMVGEAGSGNFINEVRSGWKNSDDQAINEYKTELLKIKESLKLARSSSVQNRTKIERLEKDKATIEAHLKESNYKPKDPDIERARKNVSKMIVEAISKISKLEEITDHNDKPLSSHLKRYIKKGATCSYSAQGDSLPTWQF